ncbi:MAG: hypothetical protein AUH92_03685 [Acidobacteria bacterium 13_1_40CM_4_69_4]|nr:MAG: hypothetical protein AUH92_03685 [Acidobacteria bacterium 13_1_40CM_4_69_4]
MLFRKRSPAREQQEAPPASLDPQAAPGGGRTVIGPHTRVMGKLLGDGPVVVRGAVQGTIAIRGGLSVRKGGRVDADVQAHSVDLEGEARGKVCASNRVTLSETGAFEGDMDTPILEVCPGSIVRGRARVAGLPTRERRSSH